MIGWLNGVDVARENGRNEKWRKGRKSNAKQNSIGLRKDEGEKRDKEGGRKRRKRIFFPKQMTRGVLRVTGL